MKINMSSNFFPMLSSSPPPIDDDADSGDDDDDDFGMYATAVHAFDHSLDSPVSSKSITSKNQLPGHENMNSVTSTIAKKDKISSQQLYPCDHNGETCNTEPDSACKNDTCACNSDETDRIEELGECKDAGVRDSLEPLSGDFLPHSDDTQDVLDGSIKTCNDVSPDSHDSSQNFVSSSSKCHEIKDRPLEPHGGDSEELCFQGEENSEVVSSGDQGSQTLQPSPEAEVVLSTENQVDGVMVDECIEPENVSESHHAGGCDKNGSQGEERAVVQECDDFDSPLHFEESVHGLDAGNAEKVSLSGRELPDLNLAPFPAENDDDFEEFQDADFAFDTAADNIYADSNCYDSDLPNVSSQCNESEEESFGKFESVEPVSFATFEKAEKESDATITAVAAGTPDEFADFESFHELGEQEISSHRPESDDGFADFEAAGFCEPSKEPDRGSVKVSKVIDAVFPFHKESHGENNVGNNRDVLDQNCKSRRLWERLHDTDSSPGLPFQWGVSHSFQQLLRSVNVDYHSILRTSTVPFFASGLGLLEPVKGAPVASDPKLSEDHKPIFKEPIPPVHFDWGSSGLVNPLDSGQAASDLMDLSFLSSSASAAKSTDGGSDFSLESELLKPLPESGMESSLKPHILEQLLSSGASSVTQSQPSIRPPNLSQEATRVLDQLPNISFIRAKVLMFPVPGT